MPSIPSKSIDTPSFAPLSTPAPLPNPQNDADLAKRNIQAISFELLKTTDTASKAVSPANLAPQLGMLIACLNNNNDKEKILGLSQGSLTSALETDIHQKIGEFGRNHMGSHGAITTANCVASRNPIPSPELNKVLSEFYGIERLAFHGLISDAVNNYVAGITDDQITDVFGSLNQDEREKMTAAIVSVLQFDLKWQKAFDSKQTETEPFRHADNTTSHVSMMYSIEELRHTTVGHFEAITKDLQSDNGEALQFVAIKPTDQTYKEIKQLDTDAINHLIYMATEAEKKTIALTLPKIEIDSIYNGLAAHLKSSRDVDITADKLERMGVAPNEDIKTHHNIKVSLAETGVKGVAASAITCHQRDIKKIQGFNLNQPFLAFIIDKHSQDILIAIKITDSKFLEINKDEYEIEDEYEIKDQYESEDEYEIKDQYESEDEYEIKDQYESEDEEEFTRIDKMEIHKSHIPNNLQQLKNSDTPSFKHLIKTKLNPSKEFNIKNIRCIGINTKVVFDSIEDAEKFKDKILEFLGEDDERISRNVSVERCMYMRWEKNIGDFQVSIAFAAQEQLLKKLKASE